MNFGMILMLYVIANVIVLTTDFLLHKERIIQIKDKAYEVAAGLFKTEEEIKLCANSMMLLAMFISVFVCIPVTIIDRIKKH